jgi:hypothetical protein
MGCFIQTKTGLHSVQIFGLLFFAYQLNNSALLFFFAKLPKTRAKIDEILGADFIGFHRINSTNKAAIQLISLGIAGYSFAKGDDILQNHINATDIANEISERAKHNLPKLTEERYQMYKDRPSFSKKVIAEAIERYGKK